MLDKSSATITIDYVSADLATATTYTVQTTLTSINITAAATAETLSSTITGSMSFERDAVSGILFEVSQSTNASSTLTVSESDATTTRTRVVGPFIMHDIISAGTYSYGIAAPTADSATVDSGLGPLTVKVNTPIQGASLGAAPMKQKEVDERVELTDPDVVAIVEKMIKQRRESIAQFEKAARQDLVDKEKAEIEVLSGYLPQKLGDAEVAQAVAAAIAESGASGIKDMGKVMALLKPRLAGRADMGAVSGLVKAKLSG